MNGEHEILHKELSYRVIGAALEVHNTLGCGFLEKVYENAVTVALNKNGLQSMQQAQVKVYFRGEVVGEYFADVLVENKIILELKCVERILDIHRAQMINYLKATGIRLGIIINFARPRLEYERITR